MVGMQVQAVFTKMEVGIEQKDLFKNGLTGMNRGLYQSRL